MSATRELYIRARPILDKVLEVTRERQASLVSEACGADEELSRFVRSLLRRQDHIPATDGEFDILNVLTVSLDDDAVPAELGCYKILGRLGAGGMSVVYLAEQPNPRRLVAVKILRGTVSPEILQHEVETLSLLRHPGIAQVYEAGIAATPNGARPFFVMEFVSSTGDTRATASGASARTIVEYVAGRADWTVRDRLEIIARVCDAVNYAHKRGVIHRDLKPTNILVDHLGQPRVIDFGIAMLAGPQHVEAGGAIANLVAGTPAYMSPEQRCGDPRRIDSRSDVYALGVLAYQVLTGSLPDGVRSQREFDTDARQSGETAPTVTGVTALPRDVKAVIAKATAPDSHSRYQTADDMASDLRRFIGKRPVAARRNTLPYRLSCLLRRRPVISGASLVAAVVIAASLLQAYRENAGAKDVLALLLTGMEQVDPISTNGAPPTLDRMLEGIGRELEQRRWLHAISAGQLHHILGSLYFRKDSDGDSGTLKAIPHFRKAAEVFENEYGRADVRALAAKNDLAMALSRNGQPAEAARIFEEILPLRARSSNVPGSLATRGNYAVSLMREGRLEEAMKEFDAVFNEFISIGDKFGALEARGWQASVLTKANLRSEAEEIQREALKRSLVEGAEFNELSVALADGLANILMLQEKWEDARVVLAGMRDLLLAVAPDHKIRWQYFAKTLKVQRELGNEAAAQEAVREGALWEEKYGSGS